MHTNNKHDIVWCKEKIEECRNNITRLDEELKWVKGLEEDPEYYFGPVSIAYKRYCKTLIKSSKQLLESIRREYNNLLGRDSEAS